MTRQSTPAKRRRSKQPVKGGLKGFAEARKNPNALIRDVQAHVVSKAAKNAGVGREKHKIHVSELIKSDSCPRHLFYKVSGQEPTDPPAPPFHRLEMIWATGHQEHAKWQGWLDEMGDLWGAWSCTVCGERFPNGFKPAECDSCCNDLFQYEEVNFYDEEYVIVGHADGAVPRLDTLVEVKSFSVGTVRIEQPELVKRHTHKVDGKTITDIEGLWADVKRPFKSHIKQGMFYLWFCQRMGLPYEKITFIYENKTTQATKAFEVKYSERFIAEHLKTLDDLVVAVADNVPPARPKLFAKDSRPCTACVFRTECWGEERDANQSETKPGVPTGGQGARSETPDREAAVPATSPTRFSRPDSARGHHRTQRPRPDRVDDAADTVGRAPRGAGGDGGGRRAVGGRGDGEGTRSRFARQGPRRDRAQGEGVRE